MVQSDKIATLFHSGAFVTTDAGNGILGAEPGEDVAQDEDGGDEEDEEADIDSAVWKDVARGNFIRDMASHLWNISPRLR